MRPTASVHTALDRVMKAFPDLEERTGKKTPSRRLAFLFDQLKRRGVDQDVVRDAALWIGTIPSRGVKGWEGEALEWGRLDQ